MLQKLSVNMGFAFESGNVVSGTEENGERQEKLARCNSNIPPGNVSIKSDTAKLRGKINIG